MAEFFYKDESIQVKALLDDVSNQYIIAGKHLRDFVVNEAKKNKVELSPEDYMEGQRQWVFENWRKSCLIQSLLLSHKIKIPPIIVYRSDDSSMIRKVLEGQQRVTTIYLFCNNDFKLDMSKAIIRKFILDKKEYTVDDLQGKYFKDLPKAWQDRILNCSIEVTTYNNTSEEEAELLFGIYGVGQKPLTETDKRRALMGRVVRKALKERMNNSWVHHIMTVDAAGGNAGIDLASQIVTLFNVNKPIELSKKNIDHSIYEFRDDGEIPKKTLSDFDKASELLNEVFNIWVENKKKEDSESKIDKNAGRKTNYSKYIFKKPNSKGEENKVPIFGKVNVIMLMYAAKLATENSISIDDFEKWAFPFFKEPSGLYLEGYGQRGNKSNDKENVAKRMQAIEKALTDLKGEPLINTNSEIQASTNDSNSTVDNINSFNNDTLNKSEDEQLTL